MRRLWIARISCFFMAILAHGTGASSLAGVCDRATTDSILVRDYYADIKMAFKEHLFAAENQHLPDFHLSRDAVMVIADMELGLH